jgi:flagellum-specific peptidoglycan hydrolase FlgJ
MSFESIYSNLLKSMMLASIAKNSKLTSVNNSVQTNEKEQLFTTLFHTLLQEGEPSFSSNTQSLLPNLPPVIPPVSSNTISQAGSAAINSVIQSANQFLETKNITNSLSFADIPVEHLNSMLGGKLKNTAHHFIEAGKKYNLHPALLAAISIHETGNGTSRAVKEKFNVAGMMTKQGLKTYSSIEESIFDMARNLRKNYLDQGKDTIAKIGEKYAPVGAANDPTNLNIHWVKGVSNYFNKIIS